jgi:superfamily II DNA helicase RecQ
VIAPAGRVSSQWVNALKENGIDAKLTERASDVDNTPVLVLPWSRLAIKDSTDLVTGIRRRKPGVLVVDESHFAQACGKSRRGRRLLGDARGNGLRHSATKILALTGTPILSKGPAIRAQLLLAGQDRIDPVLRNSLEYEAKYWGGRMAPNHEAGCWEWVTNDFLTKGTRGEHEALMHCLLRVNASELRSQLPNHTREMVTLDRSVSANARSAICQWATGVLRGDDGKGFDDGTPLADERRSASLSRLPALKELVESWAGESEPDEGCVIWCYYRETAKALHEMFKAPMICGDVSHARRETILSKAIQEKTKILIGTDAMSTGIDGLQSYCHRQFMLELPWTPGEVEQREGRLLRSGQKNPVLTTWLISGIEAEIARTVVRKSRIVQHLLG